MDERPGQSRKTHLPRNIIQLHEPSRPLPLQAWRFLIQREPQLARAMEVYMHRSLETPGCAYLSRYRLGGCRTLLDEALGLQLLTHGTAFQLPTYINHRHPIVSANLSHFLGLE